MPNPRVEPEWDAFLSHASEDDALATRIGADLTRQRVSVWMDHRNLRRQGLLLEALQAAIERCRHVVLLWSKDSAISRYVAAEWNFAWNRDLSIVPCQVDETGLPLGLAGYLYCDFRASFDAGIGQLRDVLRNPASTSAPRPQTAIVKSAAYDRISERQNALLDALGRGNVSDARTIHLELEPIMAAAERQFPNDADILGLAGYHRKNAYQIKHWAAIQARKSPSDPLLVEAEMRFWEALKYRPDDASALNGLGNILWLRGDLDAAAFYVQRSIERARAEGFVYPYAEEDLKNIRREQALRRKGSNARGRQG